MTISTANTPIDHTTDTGFRAWSTELYNGLTSIGWTETADTGQINLATVLRPGANLEGGYKIYSLGGTPALFARVAAGTGSSAAIPSVYLTIGTATNGAGTITGTNTARITLNTSSNLISTATSYITRMSRVDGLTTNVEFKGGATTAGALVFFSISRTVDDTGAPTADGLFLLYRSTSSLVNFGYMDFALGTFTTLPTANSFCFIPGGVTSSAVGTVPQIFRHYGPTPRIRPVLGSCTMIAAEAAEGATFSTKPVGNTTARTFVATSMMQGSVNNPSTSRICFIYE